jgi:hypothetical protein
MCCNEHHNSGPVIGVLAAFFYGLAALLRAVWWLLSRAIAPALLVAAVLAYRWSTGAPIRPSRRGRERLLTRPLRAALQNVLTLLAVGILLAPVATVAAVATAGTLTAGTAAALRWRAKRRTGPRRVKVAVGTHTGRPAAAPVAAITATATATGPTWTETQVHAQRRAA